MARYRVDGTVKEPAWVGGQHRHVAALCLEGGRRVKKAEAIASIRTGTDSYYTFAGDRVAEVEVVDRCPRCHSAYLRTNRDTRTTNNLTELPDC